MSVSKTVATVDIVVPCPHGGKARRKRAVLGTQYELTPHDARVWAVSLREANAETVRSTQIMVTRTTVEHL